VTASRLYRFSCGKRAPGTHATGGWVDQTSSLDVSEKRKASFHLRYSNSGLSSPHPSHHIPYIIPDARY